MIIKPYTSWGIDYNPLPVNDYISKVPTKRYIFQIILKCFHVLEVFDWVSEFQFLVTKTNGWK